MYQERSTAPRFKRTAVSLPIILGFLLVGGALVLGGYLDPGMKVVTSIATGVLFLGVCLFGTLTVTIYDEYLIISYGIGLIRKVIEVHSISDHRLVPNRFFSAIYNLRSEHVLQISDRRGNRAIIGLGDARELMVFLRARLNE